jgi:monofunctional biosynthetic peptidoglycan transglycosylase
MKRIILWVIVLPLVLFLLLQMYFLLQICWWINFNPSSTSFMRHQLDVLQEKNPKAQLQHKWVSYDRISNNLKRAVISSER